jgi:hypothetical protein
MMAGAQTSVFGNSSWRNFAAAAALIDDFVRCCLAICPDCL